MPYFNSEKLFICSFVFFAHISLIFFMKTEKNYRDPRVNAEIVNLVMLRELPPLKKVKSDSEIENKKNQKTPKKKTVIKPINRIEPIKKAKVKKNKQVESKQVETKQVESKQAESKQVEEQSIVRNLAIPLAMESTENFELSAPIVVQNVAYVDKKICTPKYPRVSRKRGERGKVLVKVFINRDGSSEKVEIKQSSGFNRLDQAAMESAKRCRFVPAKRNGKSVKTLATIPYTFTF